MQYVNSAERDLKIVFDGIPSILCVDRLRDLHNLQHQELNDTDNPPEEVIDIIIIQNYIDENNNTRDHRFVETVTIQQSIFQLYYVSFLKIDEITPSIFNAKVFSRHGGQDHKKWWFQKGSNPKCIHFVGSPQPKDEEFKTILCYVKQKQPNIDSVNKDFLNFIGGQSH